jgi:uncharacterized protein
MDKVVHFEIPTDDTARARDFYGSIFNWDLRQMDEYDYTLATTTPLDESGMGPKDPGAINGGIMKRSDQVKDPVITIGVDSIDDTLKKVEEKGGSTVLPRTPMGDMGAFAYFKDTEGNLLGLWETI